MAAPHHKYGLLHLLSVKGKTTVQDTGRVGWQHLGICESGAADELAFYWANKLLNNPIHAPALEVTLGQWHGCFTASTHAVLTGANTPAWLNGQPLKIGQTFRVQAGDDLRLGLPHQGVLNYLAVAGGWQVKAMCGSASQCEREGLGPFAGQPLQAGQYLGFITCKPRYTVVLATAAMAHYPRQQSLYVVIQPEYLAVLHQQGFFTQAYTLTAQCNRMGYRLLGQPIALPQCSFASAGVPFGAVQLPPGGQPIVLLKDRQTMGGYPVVACLSRLSAFALAQMRPGESVTFKPIDLTVAQARLAAFYHLFDAPAI